MLLCKRFPEIEKMFSRISDALQTAADVVAPPPTSLQEFEYHWKQVKNFYSPEKELPKVHINNTNLPQHLEIMLEMLIQEQSDSAEKKKECMEFLLTTRPLDLFVQFSITDTPPGVKSCILNWLRKFLSCIERPPIEHASLFQPIQSFVKMCNGKSPSPYEEEEIVFLETVAGLVRKEPFFINIFLPSHQHSARVSSSLQGIRSKKLPIKNSLFECSKLETNIRRVEIVAETNDEIESNSRKDSTVDDENCDISSNVSSDSNKSDGPNQTQCDCESGERFDLLDAILSYIESPDSKNVVRACEGALIICSSPNLNPNCNSINSSLGEFTTILIYKLVSLTEQIPDDMDPGDIEESNVSWGLIPRETDYNHFVGREQLHEFLCWLDYTDCVARECPGLIGLNAKFRSQFLLGAIEPALLAVDTPFVLVLMSKVIKQLESAILMEEIANWLVGEAQNESYIRSDCLLNIIIENAQDNPDVLLAALQFIEALLDNPHERVLHEMVFRYVNTRGYYDSASTNVQTWSDEEDDRERRRGSADGPIKSRTLAPHNILKVINNFLLLLPRQIMAETAGTCYEEYVQDASRHYKLWIKKTKHFVWPIEAISVEKDDFAATSVSPSSSSEIRSNATCKSVREPQCNDSGISEESFYEGPLLKLLFSHVRNMALQPCEINLAVIAILSKLAFLPHPYLHEILLNPEIPVARGAKTLWNSMQILARHLLLEIPKQENFQKKIGEAGKRLLSNPPVLCENVDEMEPLFEAIVVLEEFCKELAAITFVKYHHATE